MLWLIVIKKIYYTYCMILFVHILFIIYFKLNTTDQVLSLHSPLYYLMRISSNIFVVFLHVNFSKIILGPNTYFNVVFVIFDTPTYAI